MKIYDFSDENLATNPYKLGQAEGDVFGKQIRDFYALFKDYCQKSARLKIKVFGRFLAPFSIKYLLWLGKRFEPYIENCFREEMRGIANASQTSYRFIRLLNVLDDMINLGLCSGIAIRDNASDSFVGAANLDYAIFLDTMRENISIIHKLNFVSVGFPGHVGVLRAVNRWGVVLSSFTSTTCQSANRPGVPNGLMYNKIINNAHGIRSALAILIGAHRGASNNLMLVEKNDAVVIEHLFDKFSITGPITRNRFYVCATNHFQSARLAPHQEIKKPKFLTEVESDHFTQEFSEDRLVCLNALGTHNRAGGDQLIFNLKTCLSINPLCNQGTIFTTIFNLSQKELIVIVPHRHEEITIPLSF